MTNSYHREKIIGSGTFGSVWLVKSKASNDFFVLKELNLSSMNTVETQQALNEVTILSRCRHRNIVKYRDAVVDHKKGILSIIMEYADGGDLYSAIIKQGNVPFKEHIILTWFTQICLALQYIHHKNILHRDLKSRNIFLTKDRQIKVGDFGISRSLMDTNELATTAIGTPYYLSPEICRRKPYSYKSDIWALGCVLFEMASLSHPFQACNFHHLLTLILGGKRNKLPGHCSSLIKELVELLMKENAEERPSVDDILSISRLQPYLSEVWVKQNTNNSENISKISNERVCLRRVSSSCVKSLNSMSLKRRASSISSPDSSLAKNRFGFIRRLKSVPGQTLTTSTRPIYLKESKQSSIKTSAKMDPFTTYKIFDPIYLKRTKTLSVGSNSPCQKRHASAKRMNGRAKTTSESDRGYQSEEVKYISDKFSDLEVSDLPAKTSTKKHINASSFEILESFSGDEVFDSSSSQEKVHLNRSTTPSHGIFECSHSQCQQCMMDMLWKNRIRGVIGPRAQSVERTELIRKLKAVFGRKLFQSIYDVMTANWEIDEGNRSPNCLKGVISSLNYSQLQHLPLMMQLIQLDLVPS